MFKYPKRGLPKPRMTKADTWKKRPIVLKYWEYKDDIQKWANKNDFTLGQEVCAVFNIPMPKSWSKKKKEMMVNTHHKQKPDIDNLLKGLMDALLEEDSHVHTVFSRKVWAEEGSIVFCSLTEKSS